jgi:hypothetical protein
VTRQFKSKEEILSSNLSVAEKNRAVAVLDAEKCGKKVKKSREVTRQVTDDNSKN